jgi:mRNA interferase HigB
MVIISKTKLITYYEAEDRAKDSILRWYYETLFSNWSDFQSIKNTFNSVDSIGNDRYVFNIGGNKYRLVVMIHFNIRTIYVRFIGTHKEYDKIDCKTI